MKQRSECIGIHVPLKEACLMYTSFDMYVWYQHIIVTPKLHVEKVVRLTTIFPSVPYLHI